MRFYFASIAIVGWLVSTTVFAETPSGMLDRIEFGDEAMAALHEVQATNCVLLPGGLGCTAWRLLPPPDNSTNNWEGGHLAFSLKVDSERQNYVTIRLWGSEVSRSRLVLFCERGQIGYQHLGDYDILDFGGEAPPCNGRFWYSTTPLPLELTKGKRELRLEIRSNGPINRFGRGFDGFQRPMDDPARAVYAVYSSTNGCLIPPFDEKQVSPAAPPTRMTPGEEVLGKLKARVNGELHEALASKKPLSQLQIYLLAKAYFVEWTTAYQNPLVVSQVTRGVDEYYVAFKEDPKFLRSDPTMYNADWFAFGLLADAVRLLAEPLKGVLNEEISAGNRKIQRRVAWSEMFQASRDELRRNRRLYSNQTIINDANIYRSNRALEAIDPENAFTEEQARRYLYESIGLQPWLDSDPGGSGPVETGGRSWGVGSNYFQLTAKGLTKELGYVGYYGEVLDWVAQTYEVTCDQGKGGDAKIRRALAGMEKARGVFRYPMVDPDGNRAMVIEAIVGWRDDHYPGEVCYGERSAEEGSAIRSAAATLDQESVGYAQQMFADNQFFSSVDQLLKMRGIRVTKTLLDIPDDYALLKKQPPSTSRLPMTAGQPDFVFSDEEDGVVAVKHGEEILYASLYWRARYGVNFLARIHCITPEFDRVAVVNESAEYEPSGMMYTRPDWTAMAFGNGGVRYPDRHSALAGESLPIAKIPAGVKFQPGDESVYAGKGSFYTLHYGNYLIGMNMTTNKVYPLDLPANIVGATDLVSHQKLDAGASLNIKPRTTAVVYFNESRKP